MSRTTRRQTCAIVHSITTFSSNQIAAFEVEDGISLSRMVKAHDRKSRKWVIGNSDGRDMQAGQRWDGGGYQEQTTELAAGFGIHFRLIQFPQRAFTTSSLLELSLVYNARSRSFIYCLIHAAIRLPIFRSLLDSLGVYRFLFTSIRRSRALAVVLSSAYS